MSVTVEQVKYWHVFAGIGHVVSANLGTGWLELACGTVCTGDATEDTPKRICRKCRERLKGAVPVATDAICDRVARSATEFRH